MSDHSLRQRRTESFSGFETNELSQFNFSSSTPIRTTSPGVTTGPAPTTANTSLGHQSSFSTLQDVELDEARERPNFFKARDSIHINKQHRQLPRHGLNLDDTEGDFDNNGVTNSSNNIETSFSIANANHNNDIHQGRSAPSAFRFGKTNPAFIDDEDDNNNNNNNNNGERQATHPKSVAFNRDDQNDADRGRQTYGLNFGDETDEKPAWDTFEPFVIEDEDDTISSYWAKLALRILKIVCYVVTFCLVLVFGVLAKMSFHLLASMTRIGKQVKSCNRLRSAELNLVNKLDHDKSYHSFLNWNSPERLAWVWMVFFVMIAPDVFTLLKSLKVTVFKRTKRPSLLAIVVMTTTSTIQVIGVAIFAYVVLPSIDSTIGLMFANSIFLVPVLCLCLSRSDAHSNFIRIINYLALFVQLVTLAAWYYFLKVDTHEMGSSFGSRDNLGVVWCLPLSAILISIGFWENYVDENTAVFGGLARAKNLPKESRYRIYLFLSIWKCVIYLLAMVVIQALLASCHMNWNIEAAGDMVDHLFADFGVAFRSHEVPLMRENAPTNHIITLQSFAWAPIIVGLIQIVSSFLCYQTITFACRVCIQPFGFAMPISLVLPASVSLMNIFASIYRHDPCNLVKFSQSFEYIFWNVHYDIFDFKSYHDYVVVIIWFTTFIFQGLTTRNIWLSSKERLGSVDRLFVLPFYTSAVMDQSMMMSRRIDEETFNASNFVGKRTRRQRGETIKIYACATVWHETSSELVAMLKSIMRMDQDQCSRRLAKDFLDADPIETDYYEFETHLFVDDAFQVDKEKGRWVNQYVELLISVMNEASSNVYQPCAMIEKPVIFDTPYGGRIEWTLPGGNKLIAHLKDKNEIRHRKRWSQVMYMYYLLGYKIYEQEGDMNKRKDLTDNTFILALDGDINFRPEAVLLLVDLMRNNHNLGAACGRIHPIGSGPMAWYQKFEYAISHWLQKATEHVFGCVLCSPGCFSLFRATALTETMNKYTTRPSEAIHYVQYDQGEDRWLCTLMLQKGWRVEYSAGSDSFTHCPEGFGEFYIQRRRWAPSTMANILDLLQSYKHTIENNDNISMPYILYQGSMMLGSILSPGTIFLMLVGATNTAFGLANQYSFYLNFVPVLFFILICFFANNDIQILVAQILSTFYAMLMLAVLVSTGIEIQQDSVLSPSVIFFVGMLSIFVVAAIIHPQEFTCLFPSVIYMLTIPSMYLLLTIYSIINLNVVTWGTRETPTPKADDAKAAAAAKGSEKATNWYDVTRYFGGAKKLNFSCLCCASNKNEDELRYLQDIRDSMGKLNNEIGGIKSNIDAQMRLAKVDITQRRRASMYRQADRRSVRFNEQIETRSLLSEYLEEEEEEEAEMLRQKEEMINEQMRLNTAQSEQEPKTSTTPVAWYETNTFKNIERGQITHHEKEFWRNFIDKYLKPLVENNAHKEKVKGELIELRNKVVFAFGFINVLFVLFVFLLQMHKDMFSIDIQIKHELIGRHYNDTNEDWDEEYDDKIVKMDPIGLILITFFGALLLIQFIGMFIHRFSTFAHLIAFTDLNFFKIQKEDIENERAMKKKQALEIVRYLVGKEGNKAAYEDPKSAVYNMTENFEKNFALSNSRAFERLTRHLRLRRESINVLNFRRNTIRRRLSLHPNGLLGSGHPFGIISEVEADDESMTSRDETSRQPSVNIDNSESFANRGEISRQSSAINFEMGWNSFEDSDDDQPQQPQPQSRSSPPGVTNEWTHL